MPALLSPHLCHSIKCVKPRVFFFNLNVQTIGICGMKLQRLPHFPACSGSLDTVSFWVPFPEVWVPLHPSICCNDFPRARCSCNPSASPLFPLFSLWLKIYVIQAEVYLSAICSPILNFNKLQLFGVCFPSSYRLVQLNQIFLAKHKNKWICRLYFFSLF